MKLLNTKHKSAMILRIDGEVVGRIKSFTITESCNLPRIYELGYESCMVPVPVQSEYSLDLSSLWLAPELLTAIEAWKERQK